MIIFEKNTLKGIKMTNQTKKLYNFRLDIDLSDLLDEIILKNPEMTKSKIVNTAIRQYIESNEHRLLC